jgi:SAM-dependent methyltransferase
MHHDPSNPTATADAICAVYSGPERELWELVMGEQIHIDGLASSLALAERAGVRPGGTAVDLCCCSGAGLRFLLRFRDIAEAIGVDMTLSVLALGTARNRRDGVAAQIRLVQADARRTGLPDACADLVWGEDAWCYVPDKPALVREAVRLAKPGGTIAFTDWMWGAQPADMADAERMLRFMKFPDMASLDTYRSAFTAAGATVVVAEDTGRFAPAIERYLADLAGQHTWDALRILGFDQQLAGAIMDEMRHARDLARHGQLIQGLIVARKP